MSKDAFYFKHDSNAKDDPKCVLLIEQLGLEGYGIYWILVETLRDQPEYKYPMILISAISRRYNTSFEKMRAVISNYDLFNIDDNELFFSPSLSERMYEWDTKRAKAAIGGRASAAKRLNDRSTFVEQTLNERSSNKRREEKNKENIIKENISLDLKIHNFKTANQEKYPDAMYRDFLNHWTQKNAKGKENWECQEFFEVGKRLATWYSRAKSYERPAPYTTVSTVKKMII